MSRPKKLNEASSEVIEENFLKEHADVLPDESGIVLNTHIPVMRRVVFYNQRDPGCALPFHYASRTCPLKQYTLYHGHIHNLPEEIIEDLEEKGKPIYDERKNAYGLMEKFVRSKEYFFQFKNVKSA